MDDWGDGCPHLRIWDGECVDCLTDITWSDRSNIGRREASTRKALARVSLNLHVYGRASGHRQ